jgi:acetylornithine deacetylase/succinyl-diaminopimelate desuccinylase family protein
MASTADDVVELLSRLVARASVDPPDGACVEPSFGEGAMAALLTEILSAWGGRTETVEFAPGRFNFLARFDGADPDRTLMLEAHADTVPVEGMTIPPFEPVVRDGRLYGRGSCDCKAAMAAMLLAVRRALDEGGPPATLWFVSTGDEEVGGTGARHLVDGGFRPDAAVVGEPTGLAVVHATRGGYRFRIVTKGRAAHSSDPSRGVNAISKMARVVQIIEGPFAEELGRIRHPILGPPTVSVGVIRGGEQVNVVPDRCEIEVDLRTLPDQARREIRKQFVRQLETIAAADPEFQYGLEELAWYPAFVEDRDGPVASLVAAACEATLGRAQFKAVPWTANSGIFKEAGIPCIVFGPGSGGQAHTADESVDLDQVVKAVDVYAEIIRRF